MEFFQLTFLLIYKQQSQSKQHQSLPFGLVLEHSTRDQLLNNSGHPLSLTKNKMGSTQASKGVTADFVDGHSKSKIPIG